MGDVTALKVLGAIGAGGCWLVGGYDDLIRALLVLIVIDYLTGISAAWSSGTLSSKRGINGMLRKFAMLLVVVMASVIDPILGTDSTIRCGTIGFFIANEGLSIIENVAILGVPIPEAIKTRLEVLKPRT